MSKPSGFYANRTCCALAAEEGVPCTGEIVKIDGTRYYLCSGTHKPRLDAILAADAEHQHHPVADAA